MDYGAMTRLPVQSSSHQSEKQRTTTADEMNNSTSHHELDNCVSSNPGRYIFLSFFIVYLLFLPFFLFVLYIGFNKWKTSQSSASGGLSHSDVFTLNMVAMEITCVAGSCMVWNAFLSLNQDLGSLGGDTVLSTLTGQMLFHSLTCVERYLAVVYPVIYLRLKRGGGVILRNISVTFVWVFSVVYTLLSRFLQYRLFFALSTFLLSFAVLPLVTYCSVCVLCVLIRPKPGERGGPNKQIDKSKRSTVYTMVAILGVLLLRLMTNIVYTSLFFSPSLRVDGCVATISSILTALPSSLVLPLLFLHRAGKLKCRE